MDPKLHIADQIFACIFLQEKQKYTATANRNQAQISELQTVSFAHRLQDFMHEI